jgi:hypothetical protein
MNGARWIAKIKLLVLTGIIAAIVSFMTGWHFSFVWYVTAIVLAVMFGIIWAATELWKDFGGTRN